MFGTPSNQVPKTADEVVKVDFIFDASGRIIGTFDANVLDTQEGTDKKSGIQVMDAFGHWTYIDSTEISVN